MASLPQHSRSICRARRSASVVRRHSAVFEALEPGAGLVGRPIRVRLRSDRAAHALHGLSAAVARRLLPLLRPLPRADRGSAVRDTAQKDRTGVCIPRVVAGASRRHLREDRRCHRCRRPRPDDRAWRLAGRRGREAARAQGDGSRRRALRSSAAGCRRRDHARWHERDDGRAGARRPAGDDPDRVRAGGYRLADPARGRGARLPAACPQMAAGGPDPRGRREQRLPKCGRSPSRRDRRRRRRPARCRHHRARRQDGRPVPQPEGGSARGRAVRL